MISVGVGPSKRSFETCDPGGMPRAPADLQEVLAAACEGVADITVAQFRSLLSPEDLDDIAAGDIPVETLRAYALSFAEGIRLGRIAVPGGEA